MKKYIVLFFVFLISLCLFGCGKQKKHLNDLEAIIEKGYITVGVKADSPPFGYFQDNQRKGIDIEIAREIASAIFKDSYEEHLKFVNVDAQNRISKLSAKEVDILVATVSVNEKRKLVVNFSKPYFMTGSKIMVRKNSNISTLQYFNSKGKLAVVMGTTGEKTARQIVPNAELIGAKTYPEAFKYLKEGKVDAILGDDIILTQFKNSNFRIVNRAYSRENYAVAVRKSEDSKELLDEINVVISSLLDNKNFNLIKTEQLLDK